MIYTGYFAQLKKYKSAGLTPISIARITPAWYDGLTIPELAPSKSLLFRYKNHEITKEDYKIEYLQQLDTVKWGKVKIPESSILLCYEKPTDFCHRHILAEYLRESDYEAEEYRV